MMKKYRILNIVILIMLTFMMSSCLRSKYPSRHSYMFHVQYPKKIAKTNRKGILLIQNTTIVPQFSGRQFVYRMDNLKYEQDFYNIFFIPPAQQFNQIMTHWLQNRSRFAMVVNDSLLTANYILQTQILELYANYQNKEHPKAVMKIRFTLYQQVHFAKILRFQQTYLVKVSLVDHTSRALMQAWTIAMTRILTQASKDL